MPPGLCWLQAAFGQLCWCMCNIMGFPAFTDLAQHPQAWLLKPALLLGLAAFAGTYSTLQRPGLYGNVLVMGGNGYVGLCTTL